MFMNKQVEEKLKQIEKQYHVKVLFACEAGSRAYDLHTPSSDYDIRFIYKYEQSRYLHLYRPSEVINAKDINYDIQGWDLYKAMHLFTKSNPSLYEWMHSSVIYHEVPAFAQSMRKMIKTSYSFKTLGFHYLKLLNRNSKRNLTFSVTIEDIKVSLHLVRSYMSLTVLIKQQAFPELSFHKLMTQTEHEPFILYMSRLLVRAKQQQGTISLQDLKELKRFVQSEILRLEQAVSSLPERRFNSEEINFFLLQQHT
ncbi:nucleotidyltransferase [Priestia megaterium]|nr:nucleotidyltransferase [Priestia megaterium]